jgi:hypothetical protein
MDRTPRDSDTQFLVNLLARLKRVLCPQPRQKALQLVVLARGAHTTTTLMIAAFHENWNIRFALSPCDAMALLRKAPSAALVYDWDSHEAGWQEVCSACVQRGVHFHLVASTPSDDLFLAVAGAGGSGVLWKPLRAEQMIAAIDSARSLAGTAPDDPHDARRDTAVRSARDPNVRGCE